jgi:predicted nucleic acid-binding protein
VRFWDSSAIVALHVRQSATRGLRDLYSDDPSVVAWVLSDVEIRSALCRLAREGALTPARLSESIARVESFMDGVHVVELADTVRTRAKRLLGIHPLRAADACQLGAALAAAGDDPAGRAFVCLDDRLSEAARAEGFAILP